MTEHPEQVRTDTGPFAIVPEWVIDGDISHGAVRLYAVLAQYADASGGSFRSRRTLATRLRCSVDSVDRFTKELISAGAVTIAPRYDDAGDRTSNLYTVHRMPPGGREATATVGGTDTATGGRTDAAQNKTPLEQDPKDQGSGKPSPPAAKGSKERKTDPRADALTREWWEGQTPRPVQPFVAVRGIVSTALRAGWEPEQVAAALRRVDPPLSGGVLDRALRARGGRPTGRAQDLGQWDGIESGRSAL